MVTVKTAAKLTGLTEKGIRHYERIGLLPAATRMSNGYRMYSEADLARLQQIADYKALHFPLQDIRILLEAPPEKQHEILCRHLRRMETALEENTRICGALRQSLAAQTLAVAPRPNPARAAILAINLQNDRIQGGALYCKRIYNILPHLKHLFLAARAVGIPIIYLCDSHTPDDPELCYWQPHCLTGTWGAEIIDSVAPGPGDYVVKKHLFNGFRNTGLPQLLAQLGVDTVLVTGWRTHMCIYQTAVEAFYLGYKVCLTSNGMDATTQLEHKAGMLALLANYPFALFSCEEAVEMLLMRADPP